MAHVPDMKFTVKANDATLVRLQTAINNAKTKANELQQAVYEVNEAMADVQFIVERATPENADAGEEK